MAKMDVQVVDGWLLLLCGGSCPRVYMAEAGVPDAMAAAVRRAADHVCGRPDDPGLLVRASSELIKNETASIEADR